MSLIKKADVKNHLSARHRTEIHVIPMESQPDATGIAHRGSGSQDPKANDSNGNTPNSSAPSEPATGLTVTSQSGKA